MILHRFSLFPQQAALYLSKKKMGKKFVAHGNKNNIFNYWKQYLFHWKKTVGLIQGHEATSKIKRFYIKIHKELNYLK